MFHYQELTRSCEIYVGGDFTKAWNGSTPVTANFVARAAWDESTQIWSWSALDGGISRTDGYEDRMEHVYALAIRERTNAPGYDVIVAGAFTRAGGLPSYDLARWIVGMSDCQISGPSVQITSPAEGAIITGSNSTFYALATTTGTNTMSVVVFYRNGVLLGDGTYDSVSGKWTNSVSDLIPGPYSVMAVATGSKTNSASSAPVNFTVKAATGPTPTNDVFHVVSTGVATNLNVLANDAASTNGGSLRIVGVNKWQNPFTTVRFGSVRIGYGATNLVYQANPYSFGTNWISYDVADNNGTNTGIATVIVHALPQITIGSPTNGTVYTSSSVTTNVAGTARDYDGSISNVTLYVNGLAYGSPTTSTNFSFSWSTNTAGFYTFVAVARDNDGYTNGSPPVTVILDPPGGSLPVAVISNLVSTLVTTNFSTFTITNPPIVRDGLYDLLGQARDSDNTPSYQVVLRRPAETNDFANVTPVAIGSALNYQGFHDGSDNNGDLGILNLSTVPNGVYDLFLRVRGAGDQVSTQLRVTIDNALKIGQFSFSEQDLVIPVNGIPLTVIRTYNSFNPVQGDFGFNWTYAINDMDVVIDEDRQITSAFTSTGDDPYDGSPNLFSLRTGGGRDVTLTLPDGRRATFLFTPAFRVVGAVSTAYAEWQSTPGVTASLTMMGNNVINSFGGLGLQFPYLASGDSRTPFEAFDIEGYNLAMKDGTIYELHRDPALPGAPNVSWDYGNGSGDYRPVTPYSGKPRLTKITQRTQDTIEINSTNILHKNPSGQITRTVWFERDPNSNRITAIRDPNSNSNGVPVVRYVYNQDTRNLIQVLKLVDRSASLYLTNKYRYDHAAFPHYITEIDDARGIPAARNLYDDSGRLIGVIDASGRTNQFVHNLTNRLEIAYDRKGNATTNVYDTRGNVTSVIDSYGKTNSFAYDTNNFQLSHTDPLGNITSYVNDTNGNLLSLTLPYPASSNAVNYTTTFTYDQSGNRTSTTLPTGAVVTNSFDFSTGNLLSVQTATNTITSLTYNSNNQIASEAGQFGTNSFGYDSTGNATSLTNALKQITTSAYDANGQITNLVRTNLLGVPVTGTFQHDAQGRDIVADYGGGISINYGYQALLDWTNASGPTIGSAGRRFDEQGRLAGWTTANERVSPAYLYKSPCPAELFTRQSQLEM